MEIIRNLEHLRRFLDRNDTEKGCLADTGFLYALAYQDDRLFECANDVLDVLSEYAIPINTNVISRMEFIDLIFRKQTTLGAIHLFNEIRKNEIHPEGKDLFNLLKNIRDNHSAALKRGESFKIDEKRLKKLRNLIEFSICYDWKKFCKIFIGNFLLNEWQLLEEDLGLNFFETLEGENSEFLHSPLTWRTLVELMGAEGIRGADAMIINLFVKSHFQILISSDKDFEYYFSKSETNNEQALLLLT